MCVSVFFFFFSNKQFSKLFQQSEMWKRKFVATILYGECHVFMAVPAVGGTLTAVQHLASRGCADTKKKKEHIIRCSEIC